MQGQTDGWSEQFLNLNASDPWGQSLFVVGVILGAVGGFAAPLVPTHQVPEAATARCDNQKYQGMWPNFPGGCNRPGEARCSARCVGATHSAGPLWARRAVGMAPHSRSLLKYQWHLLPAALLTVPPCRSYAS